jgi:hypothetical protein
MLLPDLLTEDANRVEQGLHLLPRFEPYALSIGEDCKTHFPYRHRFFDPGVCSRSSWAVSS